MKPNKIIYLSDYLFSLLMVRFTYVVTHPISGSAQTGFFSTVEAV